MSTTVTRWVVQQLAAWGVKTVYGVAGDAILPLLAALNEHPRIRFYSVIHEATAAFMASAYAKLTGELGVCVATSGPGVANLLNGLMDAKKDRAPVLAITGQVASYNLDTDYKQTADENLLLAPAVGYSALASTPKAANDLLSKALRTAIAQGCPVHLAFTKDIWSKPVAQPVRPPEPYLTTKAHSSPEVIAGAFPLLNEAERPAILAGRGSIGLGPLLLDLATHWESGITLTMPAKGAVPGEHPLVLGGLGPGGSEAASKMLAETDLLLIAGARPEQQVVALVGDGGLAQSLPDFVTAVRYQLPLTIIVLKNEWLAMERDRTELLALDPWVTRLVTPDFAAFAEACGGKGYTVHDSSQLEEIFGLALNSQEPAIVQVQTAAPVFPGLVSQFRREKNEQERSVPLWV